MDEAEVGQVWQQQRPTARNRRSILGARVREQHRGHRQVIRNDGDFGSLKEMGQSRKRPREAAQLKFGGNKAFLGNGCKSRLRPTQQLSRYRRNLGRRLCAEDEVPQRGWSTANTHRRDRRLRILIPGAIDNTIANNIRSGNIFHDGRSNRRRRDLNSR
ncbi:hypothetical protein CF319_g9380 [Tilletia indica]|nr:hypothetical protein CF319_g9380 [Tilletia indica]